MYNHSFHIIHKNSIIICKFTSQILGGRLKLGWGRSQGQPPSVWNPDIYFLSLKGGGWLRLCLCVYWAEHMQECCVLSVAMACVTGLMQVCFLLSLHCALIWLLQVVTQAWKRSESKESSYYIYKDSEKVDNQVLKIKEQILNRKSLMDLIKYITQWNVFQRWVYI